MSTTTVPRHADLRRLVAAGAGVEGTIALADLIRLREAVADRSGEVQVALAFGLDDEGYRSITGSVRATPMLQCQRCLGNVAIELDAGVSLALVWREQEIPSLPARYEGLIAGTEPVDLYELIEEELLLCMPLAPKHETGACSVAMPVSGAGQGGEDACKENPFAVALRRR